MKAKLILENNMEFEGTAFGYTHETVGEVVFNTGMTGYQEVLTDPSYYGQVVVMTYPLIGNYGINLDDSESSSPKVKGFVVREKSKDPNNFRCELELDNYLKSNKIMGLEGIDTRALTKLLRVHGTMKGIIVLESNRDSQEVIHEKIQSYSNQDAVLQVSTKIPYYYSRGDIKVALIDFGVKNNILRNFEKRNCSIKVYPHNAKAEDILKDDPQLIFLSNGPGDPLDMGHAIKEIQILAQQKPVAGICLGHQLLALAFGGKTGKLKFGHRGCNHPVKNLLMDRVHITSQNHSYYVTQLPDNFEITHVSMNDNTVEGMRHKEMPIFSVQFHPEASPGPIENEYIFDEFIKYAQEVQNA